ncbi:MAG: sodium:solute symporter [Candidatus Neomarinimicrobiota bacterium]|nr:sodium:solute symporter [Candidatus Neomarinimicrobiota bacterium]
MQTVDFIVLFGYLTVVSGVALWAGRKQTTARSFFLAEQNLPWWMIMLSVVATETSVLTFLSIPGVAYGGDFGFLQLAIGYVIGRWLVAHYLLPLYFEQGLESTYEFLRNRWGESVQRTGSLVFQLTRILADGVRLFMTAIPLALITGWSYPMSIAVIAGFTLIYTILGGIRSVVWADSIQFIIYLLGGAITMGVLGGLVDGGWSVILATAYAEKKLVLFHGGELVSEPYHFITAVVGGMFLSLASHGTDHLMVQRLMAAKNAAASRKALIGSGFMALFQFAIFLIIGAGIWVYYGGKEMNSNEVFSSFIIDSLPAGVKGLIVAAIFSAAMSSLSSSINALASSTMSDWVKTLAPSRYTLANSRLLSLVWTIVLAGGASLFTSTEGPLVEIGLAIVSFTYGGLLGFFLLGRMTTLFSASAVMAGFFSSIVIMIAIVRLTPVAWPWYTCIGLTVMVTVSYGVRFFQK